MSDVINKNIYNDDVNILIVFSWNDTFFSNIIVFVTTATAHDENKNKFTVRDRSTSTAQHIE